MAKNRTVTAYVIRAVEWIYNDEYYDRYDGEENAHVKTFLSREKAEAHRQKLERRKRREWGMGITAMGGYEMDLSTRPHAEIVDALRAAGLEPPADPPSFLGWVYENEDGMNPQQLNVLWELCDNCRFYDVVPVQIQLEV